nr:MAG TPA: hypothetical protein [Crassvirales sp.]
MIFNTYIIQIIKVLKDFILLLLKCLSMLFV